MSTATRRARPSAFAPYHPAPTTDPGVSARAAVARLARLASAAAMPLPSPSAGAYTMIGGGLLSVTALAARRAAARER